MKEGESSSACCSNSSAPVETVLACWKMACACWVGSRGTASVAWAGTWPETPDADRASVASRVASGLTPPAFSERASPQPARGAPGRSFRAERLRSGERIRGGAALELLAGRRQPRLLLRGRRRLGPVLQRARPLFLRDPVEQLAHAPRLLRPQLQ